MAERLRDPRLVEIDFLMDLEREERLTLVGHGEKRDNGMGGYLYTGAGAQNEARSQVRLYGIDPRQFRDMVHSLLTENLICGFGDEHPTEIRRGIPFGLIPGQELLVQLTHAGRVHLWNMRDALLRNRLKDPTGILFDGRNAERDLQIALWAASDQEPLAVAFVDMNGLKAINDTAGHDAGDEAVRAYFDAIAAVIAEAGDAYRVGGDEVVIVLPKTSLADGAKLLGRILRGLSSQTVIREAQRFQLSACAGITAAIDPGETAKAVRARADAVQYMAKVHSKLTEPRLGALAVDGGDTIEEFPPIVAAPADAPK